MNLLATPFARRTSRPVRKPARTAAARRPGLDRVEQFERRELLAVLAGGVERTTPDDFFTDFSVGMTSEYTAYTITNDASGPATDVWVKALFPVGSPVGVGSGYNNEDGLYHVGTLAPNTSGTAFLYFTANALSATPVPYSIEVYDGEPGNGGALLVTKPFSLTTVVNTLAAEPNKVETVAYSPANPQIGDTLTLSVTGRLGNGADRVLFAPASATSWEPDVFELRSTSHTISGIAQTPNGLFYDGLTDLVNQQPFTSTYDFLITRQSSTSTLTSPTQFTQDGAQAWKHHKPDATPFPTIPPIPPRLTLTKSDGVTTYTPGGMTTYTIVLANTGAGAASGVVVSDTLPVQLNAATTTWTVAYSNASGTLPANGSGNIGGTVDLAPLNGVVTITINGAILSSALGDMTNTVTATVSGSTLSASDTNTAAPLANLTITKTDEISTVLAGGGTIQIYTLRVRNNGVSDARTVVVNDTWPADFTRGAFGTPSQGSVASGPGSNFTWTIGTLAANAEATLTVNYTVPASTLPGNYLNTASVTSSTPDPDPANTATDTTTVTTSADLRIAKTDSATIVTAGDGVTHNYLLTVTNLGASDAQNVAVSDLWPDEFAQAGFGAPSQGTVTPGVGGDFSWSLGVLPAGGVATLVVSYTVPSATLPGPYVNTATVTSSTLDPNPDNTATDTTTVIAMPDLSITKTDGVATVVAGGGTVQTYTITVRNSGISDARGVVATDDWPADFTPGTFGTPSQGSVTTGVGGDFIWTVGTLSAGGSATLTVTYTVAASVLPGPRTNTATVTSTDDPETHTTADTTTVLGSADLIVAKTDFTTTATAGDGVVRTYLIRVNNGGVSDAQGVVLTDAWPAGFDQTTIGTPSQGTVASGPGGDFTWSIGTLPAGVQVTLQVSYVIPSATLPGAYVNTATVRSQTPDPFDNNSVSDTTTVVAVSDLWITKRNGDAPYTPGTALTYTITVGNFGPSTVFGTTVSDPLPEKTTFVSASSGATYDPVTKTVTFPVGRLDPGATQVFTLTVLTDPDRRGPLINTATVAVPPGWIDPDLDNNFVIDPAADTPLVALGVTKTDGKTTYVPGTSTTYTIVVTNSGPSTLLGGTVSDPLPALASGGTWTAVATLGSSATPAGGSGDLNALIDLAPGGTITFTYVVAIKGTASGNLVNTVTVSPPRGTAGGGVSATDIDVSADVPALVLGTDDGCLLAPWVKIINPTTGGLIRQFLAYEATFRGSVRVATGDLTGDGVAEIVVAPGRGRVGEIRVFTQQGVELTRYRTLPFGATWVGGVEVAVGDVNRDGTNDIIAGQATGAGRVKVFQVLSPVATDPVVNVPIRSFRPFVSPYALGVMVAAGDFGTYSGGVKTSSAPDGRSEIVVGTNAGIRVQVRIYDASTVNPVLVTTLLPFASTFTGGVSLSTGRYTIDNIDDVMIGAGVGGESRVQVYNGKNWNLRQNINAFSSFGRPNAAVFAAMLDLDGDGVATDVYGVQGRNATGGTNGVRRFNRLTSVTTLLPQSTVNAPPLRIVAIKLRNA